MFSVTTGCPAAAPPAAPSPGSLGHRRLHKSSRLQSSGRGLNPDATPALPGYRGPGPPGSTAARAAGQSRPGPSPGADTRPPAHVVAAPVLRRSLSETPRPRYLRIPRPATNSGGTAAQTPSDTVTRGSSPGTDSGTQPTSLPLQSSIGLRRVPDPASSWLTEPTARLGDSLARPAAARASPMPGPLVLKLTLDSYPSRRRSSTL